LKISVVEQQLIEKVFSELLGLGFIGGSSAACNANTIKISYPVKIASWYFVDFKTGWETG
jgi:hypothetical protein